MSRNAKTLLFVTACLIVYGVSLWSLNDFIDQQNAKRADTFAKIEARLSALEERSK